MKMQKPQRRETVRGGTPHWAPVPEKQRRPRFVAVINAAHPERNAHTTATIPSPRHPGECREVPVVRFANEADGEALSGHVLLEVAPDKKIWWRVRT